jgi:hypothetical protein
MRRNTLRLTKKYPDSWSGYLLQLYKTNKTLEHVVSFHTHDPVTTRCGFEETGISIVSFSTLSIDIAKSKLFCSKRVEVITTGDRVLVSCAAFGDDMRSKL